MILGLASTTCDHALEPPERSTAERDHDHRVFFERRTFVPAPDVDGFLSSGTRHGILQFHEPPRTLEPLRALGIAVHGVQHKAAYYVTIPRTVTRAHLGRVGARALFAMRPLDKISMRLVPLEVDQLPSAGEHLLAVRFVPATAQDEIMTTLMRLDATLVRLDSDRGRAVIQLASSALMQLAQEDWVWWIDAESRALTPDLDVAIERIGAAGVRPPPWGSALAGTGLTGDGVAVGVWEVPVANDAAGVLDSHPDLSGRVAFGPGQGALPSFHATQVAGVIAGDGTASQPEGGAPFQWSGVAPQAHVISWDAADAAMEMVTSLAMFDTTITNHSFGTVIDSQILCGAAGFYDAIDAEYDDVVRNSGIAAFVSPGNNGEHVGALGCAVDIWDDGAFGQLPPDIVDAGYGSVSALGVAKNPVAVGGRRKSTPLGTAAYSGRGPTRDGRLAPLVVAVSGDEESLLTMPSTPQTYDSDLGVSYAVPQATGAAALLLEHYRQGDPTFIQDPAVFKAVLANTATDVGAPGPDYGSGYGLIQISEAVSAAESYAMVTVGQGDVELLSLSVDLTDACGLRVMAAWNDPPAMPPCFPRLVNDIDLSVVSDDSEVLPWVLTPSNPLNPAVRGINALDNTEQVTIDEPIGDELVRLVGTSVPMGPQEVVVHWYAVPCGGGAEGGEATESGGAGDDGGAGCSCQMRRERVELAGGLLVLVLVGARGPRQPPRGRRRRSRFESSMGLGAHSRGRRP
ncbi:MAG: S8 family serine peptidase [Myxococcales bacterium]|nr:S8 family serine peptidase [Myxococcales bacterium]